MGTDKHSGLLVYDLSGNQLQHLPVGNLNNVDLRAGAWGRDNLTIVVASARQPDELVVFELDHARRWFERSGCRGIAAPKTSGVRVGRQLRPFFLGQAVRRRDRCAGSIEKRRGFVGAREARPEYSPYTTEDERQCGFRHGIDDAPVADSKLSECARPQGTERLVDGYLHRGKIEEDVDQTQEVQFV